MGSRKRPIALVGMFFFGATLLAQETLRIGSITVQSLDVFSQDEAARGWVYRMADSLHATTRESVIRRFLLFEEGDEFDPQLLSETERNLRSLRFIKSAQVVAGPPHDGVVDVTVATQDAWTFQLGLAIGSVGGRLIGGVTLGERSLLGSGREVSVGFGQDTVRTHRLVEIRDPALFARYGAGYVRYASNSDGAEKILEYQRPFYSVVAPWALALGVRDVEERNSLYANGEETSVYSHRARSLVASYGIALRASVRGAFRLGAGLDWREDQFSPFAGHPDDARPPDRRYRYAFVEGESVGNDFVKLDYVNRDLRVEDFSLGRRLAVRFGVSPTAFGVPRTTEMARVTWEEGWRVGPQDILQAGVSGETRLDTGQVSNAIVSGKFLFIRRFETSWPQTFVARLDLVKGWNLDPDVQFFADGSTGLRAYRLYSFEGDKRILLNLEHRVFSGQEVLQLVAPSAAIFFDAAAIAPAGSALRMASVRTDVGIGLRFAITRVSSVPIVRIDVGYALQPDPRGRRGWLVSFSGGQAF